MGTRQAGNDPGHDSAFEQWGGPTAARMLVGAQLRRLREAAHLTREEAADVIRASCSKISRLELGRTGFKPRDVSDLLTLYGVCDPEESATLLALAKQANAPAWWHVYGDVVPGWLGPYLGLEQAAGVIRIYEVQLIPGLFQTPDYARAVIRSLLADSPGREVERRVELRMVRQQILYRANPPRVWAVIDEAALLRPVGGPATMRAQLEQLIEVSRLPHVSVQVLPLRTAQLAVGVPITLLRFGEGDLPDVAYLEQLAGGTYLEKPSETDRYLQLLDRLGVAAEPPEATRAILQRVLSGA